MPLFDLLLFYYYHHIFSISIYSFSTQQGHFVRSLGGAGEKDTEQEVLLLEHDVPHQAFSQAVLSFLPKMPWAITPEVNCTFLETMQSGNRIELLDFCS